MLLWANISLKRLPSIEICNKVTIVAVAYVSKTEYFLRKHFAVKQNKGC